jgi:hypothetical protein
MQMAHTGLDDRTFAGFLRQSSDNSSFAVIALATRDGAEQTLVKFRLHSFETPFKSKEN